MPKKKNRGNSTGSVYFDKSKGLWYAQIPTGYKNGKQQFSKRSFMTKTDAANGLAALKSDLNMGELVEPDKLTVQGLLEQWIEWKAPRDLRETTEASYRREIRLRLVPLLGPLRVQSLAKADIERAYKAMLEPRDDHRNNGKQLVISIETVRVAARVLKLALKEWGVGRGVILRNPADEAKLPRVRAKRGEVGGGRNKYEPYSATELRKFLEATYDHHLFIAFYLAGAMGLREGEVVGLRWRDLRIEPGELSPQGEGELRVSSQRTRVGGKIIEGPPKSDRGVRPIPLSAQAVATLKIHKAQQRQQWAEEYGWAWSKDTYLITKPEDGTPIRPESVWKRFRAITNRLGLRPVAFHDLRHGFVSIMAAERIPAEVISRLVGHHSASFTVEAYRHVFASEGIAASKTMDKITPDPGIRVLPDHSGAVEEEMKLTPLQVRRKLTAYQAQRIKQRIEAGERPEDVALDFGISGRMARYIASGERYERVSQKKRKKAG